MHCVATSWPLDGTCLQVKSAPEFECTAPEADAAASAPEEGVCAFVCDVVAHVCSRVLRVLE